MPISSTRPQTCMSKRKPILRLVGPSMLVQCIKSVSCSEARSSVSWQELWCAGVTYRGAAFCTDDRSSSGVPKAGLQCQSFALSLQMQMGIFIFFFSGHTVGRNSVSY